MLFLLIDEADIIKDNILYHGAAGVDHFIVTDNGSIDGTRDILEDLKRQVNLTILDEPSTSANQDLWVARMAYLVRDDDYADWVISNDADEFWLTRNSSLKEAIAADLSEAEQLQDKVGTLY